MRAGLLATVLLGILCRGLSGQVPQATPSVTTLQVNSRLVFLDVTVLDRKGNPVVTGLTKDDFSITEDKQPQKIFSFEVPREHLHGGVAGSDKAPSTVFVLDLLNSSFEDFAFIRYSVQKYLKAQPAEMESSAELMVLGNRSLEMVQGLTRSKQDLLDALDHVPAIFPYKLASFDFDNERAEQSIVALQEIALQSSGVPGRKNIVWVGRGGPGIPAIAAEGPNSRNLERFVHETTNMLVDARMSLFVIYPGLSVQGADLSIADVSNLTQDLRPIVTRDIDDPFSGDINFAKFVSETGGSLFYNRNDVDLLMKRSLQLGSEFYTLTYQPPDETPDGKFRKVHVSMRDPSLKVVTKGGFYAPDKDAAADPRRQSIFSIAEAVHSIVPLTALNVTVRDMKRHPDTGMLEVTLRLDSKDLTWQAAANGKSTTELLVAAASLNERRDILSSRLEEFGLSSPSQDKDRLARTENVFSIHLPMPRKTRSVRLVIQNKSNQRLGSVEVARASIDAAPAMPTPTPGLVARPTR